MCGICGAIGVEPASAAEAVVRRMLAALVHRGPDDEGLLIAPRAALGMRRLSIIDLPGGGQPVWNETRTIAVLYNGEIYNFRELRAELESLGHAFRTKSDTEVVVHAYESWGEDCPKRFHGMFAFAIVEMPEGAAGPATKIFLARDAMGIKPLYYAATGGAFVFASEVRALLASGRVPPHISAEALPSYLLFGSVGEPTTLIDGVRVAAARPLAVSSRRGSLRFCAHRRKPIGIPLLNFARTALPACPTAASAQQVVHHRQPPFARCSKIPFAAT